MANAIAKKNSGPTIDQMVDDQSPPMAGSMMQKALAKRITPVTTNEATFALVFVL